MGTMKNRSNTESHKENDNFPANESKNKEYCDLTDKQLKIAIKRKFYELQENLGNTMISGIKLINGRSTLPK